MADVPQECPVCGERLATKGLSFFMINLVVAKHCEASPRCQLQVELNPDEKSVEIKRASNGDDGGE